MPAPPTLNPEPEAENAVKEQQQEGNAPMNVKTGKAVKCLIPLRAERRSIDGEVSVEAVNAFNDSNGFNSV